MNHQDDFVWFCCKEVRFTTLHLRTLDTFPLRELARQNLKLVQKGNHDHELHADSCFLLQADFTIPIERAVGLLFDPSVADKMDRF